MAKSLSILYVTSEVFPFAKVGGLADASHAFTLAVRDFGHDIRVMLPKYGNVSERKNKIHEINRLKDIPIPVGKESDLATVKSSSMASPRTKVQAYITTNQKYFDLKKTFYTDVKTGLDLPDNDERFIFFQRSVVETCMLLGWVPDIIHCNDWYSALIPAYVKMMYTSKFKKTKVIFSIHNFARQGVFPASTFEKTGFGKELKKSFIHKNSFNFMKAGLMFADYITTNSPTYAEEMLKDADYSDGLNKVLAEKSDKFSGILLGLDGYHFNPKHDPEIAKKLTDDTLQFKNENKKQLCKDIGMPFQLNVPLVGMVSRINDQKGIPLLIESVDKLMKENVNVVVLGQGNSELKAKLKKIATKYPQRFIYIDEYNEKLAHQIYAGSDLFLSPGSYAPSGLSAMFALNMATLPVVVATGAHQDFIINFNAKTKKGNGFVLTESTSNDFLKQMKSALVLFNDREIWNTLMENALSTDLTWTKSVRKYDEIYKNVFKES